LPLYRIPSHATGLETDRGGDGGIAEAQHGTAMAAVPPGADDSKATTVTPKQEVTVRFLDNEELAPGEASGHTNSWAGMLAWSWQQLKDLIGLAVVTGVNFSSRARKGQNCGAGGGHWAVALTFLA